MEKSVFEKIIDNELNSYKFYEDDNFIVILDLFPVNLGHSLIIPKQKKENLLLEDSKTLFDLILLTKKITSMLQEKLKTKNFKITSHIGASAGQTVFHTHIHIIPYYEKHPKLKKTDFNQVLRLILD